MHRSLDIPYTHPIFTEALKHRTSRLRTAPFRTPQACTSCGASSPESDVRRIYGGEEPDSAVAFCAECLDHGRPEEDGPECGGEG